MRPVDADDDFPAAEIALDRLEAGDDFGEEPGRGQDLAGNEIGPADRKLLKQPLGLAVSP